MIQDDVVSLINPLIKEMGYILWGCEYVAQGRHTVLRIYIDKTSGIGIEDCERVSREVSALLDVEDPIPGYYRLEVSSPGVPRPLFYEWQYVDYVGQDIRIKLLKPQDGRRVFSGIIITVIEGTVTLECDDGHRAFQISEIVKANLTG